MSDYEEDVYDDESFDEGSPKKASPKKSTGSIASRTSSGAPAPAAPPAAQQGTPRDGQPNWLKPTPKTPPQSRSRSSSADSRQSSRASSSPQQHKKSPISSRSSSRNSSPFSSPANSPQKSVPPISHSKEKPTSAPATHDSHAVASNHSTPRSHDGHSPQRSKGVATKFHADLPKTVQEINLLRLRNAELQRAIDNARQQLCKLAPRMSVLKIKKRSDEERLKKLQGEAQILAQEFQVLDKKAREANHIKTLEKQIKAREEEVKTLSERNRFLQIEIRNNSKRLKHTENIEEQRKNLLEGLRNERVIAQLNLEKAKRDAEQSAQSRESLAQRVIELESKDKLRDMSMDDIRKIVELRSQVQQKDEQIINLKQRLDVLKRASESSQKLGGGAIASSQQPPNDLSAIEALKEEIATMKRRLEMYATQQIDEATTNNVKKRAAAKQVPQSPADSTGRSALPPVNKGVSKPTAKNVQKAADSTDDTWASSSGGKGPGKNKPVASAETSPSRERKTNSAEPRQPADHSEDGGRPSQRSESEPPAKVASSFPAMNSARGSSSGSDRDAPKKTSKAAAAIATAQQLAEDVSSAAAPAVVAPTKEAEPTKKGASPVTKKEPIKKEEPAKKVVSPTSSKAAKEDSMPWMQDDSPKKEDSTKKVAAPPPPQAAEEKPSWLGDDSPKKESQQPTQEPQPTQQPRTKAAPPVAPVAAAAPQQAPPAAPAAEKKEEPSWLFDE